MSYQSSVQASLMTRQVNSRGNHGQSEMQILETLVDAFPAIARVNIDSLVTKAKAQYKAQFTTERVTVDETSAVDKL